jgi:hypothetical protein
VGSKRHSRRHDNSVGNMGREPRAEVAARVVPETVECAMVRVSNGERRPGSCTGPTRIPQGSQRQRRSLWSSRRPSCWNPLPGAGAVRSVWPIPPFLPATSGAGQSRHLDCGIWPKAEKPLRCNISSGHWGSADAICSRYRLLARQLDPRVYPFCGPGLPTTVGRRSRSATIGRTPVRYPPSEIWFLGFRDVRVLVVVVFVRIFGTDPFGYVVGPRHIS